mmetsp:Transcript_24212/g.23273  ORF Transcript_24212/g.23273 Transcript_24212/m.23273 type:complete len:160 (+) Transcript_24212:183-662(+)
MSRVKPECIEDDDIESSIRPSLSISLSPGPTDLKALNVQKVSSKNEDKDKDNVDAEWKTQESVRSARALSTEFNMENKRGTRRASLVGSMFALKYGRMYNIFLEFTSDFAHESIDVKKEFDQFKRSDFNMFLGFFYFHSWYGRSVLQRVCISIGKCARS